MPQDRTTAERRPRDLHALGVAAALVPAVAWTGWIFMGPRDGAALGVLGWSAFASTLFSSAVVLGILVLYRRRTRQAEALARLSHEAAAAREPAAEEVPPSLADSETLSALWRRGRGSGRDEVRRAIEGLRDSGEAALKKLRRAVEEERAADAATCAQSLAGVAAVLGCRTLESRCRAFAAGEADVTADDLDRELAAAVAELWRRWPGSARE